MKASNLLTTINDTGIATTVHSDPNQETYLVSTVFMPNTGYFQTMVLIASNPHYRIERRTMEEAVDEHIDTVNMVLTKQESSWNGAKPYQNELLDEFTSSKRQFDPIDWNAQIKEWDLYTTRAKLKKAGLQLQKLSLSMRLLRLYVSWVYGRRFK